MVPLALLNEGERGVIERIIFNERDSKNLEEPLCEEGCFFCKGKRRGNNRIKTLGFTIGQVVEVRLNQQGQPLLVQLENTQIALSRKLAMKIYVKKL